MATFPSPDELWAHTFATANAWRDRFAAIPFEDKSRVSKNGSIFFNIFQTFTSGPDNTPYFKALPWK